MNTELVKSSSRSSSETGIKDPSSDNQSIPFRLARYLDRIKHLESENIQTFLKEADIGLAEQQERDTQGLQKLREQYESQMCLHLDNIKDLFHTKFKTVERASQRDKVALEHALKGISVAYNLIDKNNSQISVLEQMNESLNDRISKLQANLENEQSRSIKFQEVVNALLQELAFKKNEYQKLLDADAEISLNSELAEYDNLLSIAEKRLKLSSS